MGKKKVEREGEREGGRERGREGEGDGEMEGGRNERMDKYGGKNDWKGNALMAMNLMELDTITEFSIAR